MADTELMQEYQSQQTNAIPSADFRNVNQGTVMVEATRSAVEAQGMLALAKQFPRNYIESYAKAIEMCKRKDFANKAFFKYPRGGKSVTGVTIRFAEALATAYGNLDYGIKELSHDEGKSEMQAYCWDLESNTRTVQNFTVEHIRESNGSTSKLTSQRDIYEKTANDGARRLRSRILAILPPELIEACIEECQNTLSNDLGMSLADKIKKMVVRFKEIGVTQQMIEDKLGHKAEAINNDEMTELIGIYQGIMNKETTISDWFEQPKTASQMTALLKDEVSSK